MLNLSALSSHTGIAEDILVLLVTAAQKHANRALLYGSRARGDHRPTSDMDIAFYGDEAGYSAFMDEMEALPTLLEFDCVHVTEKTSDLLVENIKKDGIILMDTSFKKSEQLAQALNRLEESIAEYAHTGSKSVRDGAIQRFEFSSELAWKAARDFMLAQGYLEINSPKAVMRKAYQEKLITDEQGWVELLNARNQTSHLYDDNMADTVYQAIKSVYQPLMRALLVQLTARLDA